jgi:hypothetical protein
MYQSCLLFFHLNLQTSLLCVTPPQQDHFRGFKLFVKNLTCSFPQLSACRIGVRVVEISLFEKSSSPWAERFLQFGAAKCYSQNIRNFWDHSGRFRCQSFWAYLSLIRRLRLSISDEWRSRLDGSTYLARLSSLWYKVTESGEHRQECRGTLPLLPGLRIPSGLELKYHISVHKVQ